MPEEFLSSVLSTVPKLSRYPELGIGILRPPASIRIVNELTDNELVCKVLEGETGAFRLLVERHQNRMFYLGLKFLHSREDAEDFAQEVFVRAYERLRSFSRNVPFSAWLYRIGVNWAINKYHVKRRELMNVSIGELEVEDARESPETHLLNQEFSELLREKLAELPAIYQLVIKLHFFDGFPYKGISRILSIPVNTIKSHVRRAKLLLERKLGPYAHG